MSTLSVPALSSPRASLAFVLALAALALSSRPAAAQGPAGGDPIATLSIVSRVRGAQVEMDGEPIGATPVVDYALPAGGYVVRVRFPSGESWERRVVLQAGRRTTLHANPQSLVTGAPGARGGPPTAHLPVVPLPAGSLPPGWGAPRPPAPFAPPPPPRAAPSTPPPPVVHAPPPVVPSPPPLPAPLTLPPAQLPPPAPVALRAPPAPAAAVGHLSAVGPPDGLPLSLDGRPVGVTPLYGLPLEVGLYVLRAAFPDERVFELPVQIRAGQHATVQIDASQAHRPGQVEPSRLRVLSEPAGAAVRVDGELRGETPLQLDDLAFGNHELEIRLPGHRTVTRTVELKPAAREKLQVKLKRYRGAVAVKADDAAGRPVPGTLLVDGLPLGDLPYDGPAPLGAHELRVVSPHGEGSLPVTIEAGNKMTVGIRVQR